MTATTTSTRHAPTGTPSTMRAAVRTEYGSSDVLRSETVPVPNPRPDEVLVEVRAAGVDRGTWHLMAGMPYLMRLAGFGLRRPKQPVLGMDVSGRVVAIGSDVTRFAVGDEVFGIGDGTFAEYAIAKEAKLARKPDGITHEQAAASSISGITALQALTDVGRLEAGQRVLVIGGSGGVGTFAVQLARLLGGRVDAVAGTANLDLVRSLGARQVFDHRTQSLDDIPDRYDLILDIGGRNPLRRLRRRLTDDGTLVIVGGEGGDALTGGIGRQLRAMALSPFVSHRMTTFISSEGHQLIDRLAGYLASATVTPVIRARFPLADTREALRQLERGATSGKAVIVVRDDQKLISEDQKETLK